MMLAYCIIGALAAALTNGCSDAEKMVYLTSELKA